MTGSRSEAMAGAARALGETLAASGVTGLRLLQELPARPNLLTPEERRAIAEILPRRRAEPESEGGVAAELERSMAAVFRDFSPRPSASSALYEVYRAVLADGAPVFVRLARRPEPAGERGARNHLRSVCTALGEHAPGRVRRLYRELAGIGDGLDESAPDLRNDAAALEALARNGRRAGELATPQVRREATGRRLLAIENPGASTLEECLTQPGSSAARASSRTLCLGWLGQALAGGPFPCACGSTELALTDAGEVLFLGGELRRLPRHKALALSDFLAFLAEDDPERAAHALRPALEDLGGNFDRWRRALRQGSPFLDGGWNEHEEWLAPKALLAWRWIREIGFRLDRETEGFFRGLARVSLIVEQLSPEVDAMGQAHIELRTRLATRTVRNLADPLAATTAVASLTDATIALPTALERALGPPGSSLRTGFDEISNPARWRAIWTTVFSALTAGTGIVLAVERLVTIPGWESAAEPVGFGLMLALGSSLLVSIFRRS